MRRAASRGVSAWLFLAIVLVSGAGALTAASSRTANAAGTYYVSPSGTDDASHGTQAAPWKTPGYASKQLHAGDTLVILGGRYTLSAYWDDMITPPTGTAGAWVTIRGETGNRPVLAGRDNLFSAVDISGTDYVRIENLEITSDNGAQFRGGIAASGGPVNHVVLEDLYVHHVDEGGLDVRDANDLLVESCNFSYCGFGCIGGPEGQQGGNRNIRIRDTYMGYSGHYYQGGPGPGPYDRPDGFGIEPSEGPVEIDGCVVEHNLGDGLDSKSANTWIHECLVANNYGDGVKLWDHDGHVENTLIYGTGADNQITTPWVGLIAGDSDTPGARFDIVNVTVCDNVERQHYAATFQYGEANPINVVMRNTTISNAYGVAYFEDSVNLTAEHDNFYMPGKDAQVHARGRDYTGAQIAAGELGAGNMSSDPGFVNRPPWGAIGDFHLRSDSPLRDAGSSMGAPAVDLDGNVRPAGGASDIGAYEYGSSPAPAPASGPASYLAEGTTAWGFDTYITLENPNSEAVTAVVTYMTADGPVTRADLPLPAMSQTTINPRDDLGDRDFSTTVECREGKTIAVDRTMTWRGEGSQVPERHSSVGVPSPATTWYLPEGSSDWGFETWLLIQNPNEDSPANCTVTYMVEGEGPVDVRHLVPAASRATFNMYSDVGAKDASIKVVSDVPVIPERAMYRNNRREGHDSVGTTTPSSDFYLAEGTTGWGFTTFVLIGNPQGFAVDVDLTYMTSSGPVRAPTFQMPANSRKTVNVNATADLPDPDFSTHVHASAPVAAERAMYWDSGQGEACHDSIGIGVPHSVFYLPDGESGPDVETWTLIGNPNDTDVQVRLTYLTPTGRDNHGTTETIPANSRRTFNMLSQVENGRASVLVECLTAGGKILCERAMYWNSRGAGTDTIGGYSD